MKKNFNKNNFEIFFVNKNNCVKKNFVKKIDNGNDDFDYCC